jgi:hypothetical protein
MPGVRKRLIEERKEEGQDTHGSSSASGVRGRLCEEGQSEVEIPGSSSGSADRPTLTSARSVRQRVGHAIVGETKRGPQVPTGPFVQSLKRDWAKGQLSARQIQEYATTARDQGAEGLDRLASVGTDGKYASNIHKQLLRMCSGTRRVPPT